MKFFRRRKKNRSILDIAPDEIFLDARNLPSFDTHQLEGRLKKSIEKKTIISLGIVFIIIGALFVFRVWALQVQGGGLYSRISDNNHLNHSIIFSERGVIYDRNGVELVWNTPFSNEAFAKRTYSDSPGLGHVLGYISYPLKDSTGIFYQQAFVGKDGVERAFETYLSGKNGVKIIETDVYNEIISESTALLPESGKNLSLAIDSRLQSKMFELIKDLSNRVDFTGGAGIVMDIQNGELLVLTSYPEFDSNLLSEGNDREAIQRYVNDERKPFLNRATNGLYSPGSTIKPFVALGALSEGVVTPQTKILSTGSIEIPNPYDPEKTSVFVDWKAHGLVNVVDAIAVSSNVYFYEVAGGYKDQLGIGIKNLEKYVRLFGVGEETGLGLFGEAGGVIPNPEWKALHFEGDEWRVGDTYNSSIGQYGFQVTPIQMARGIAAIANEGVLVVPKLALQDETKKETISSSVVPPEYFKVVKEGMREGVLRGTASGLNIGGVNIAAKTGTAQIGVTKKRVNSWAVGFFPYENPQYVFVVVMEEGPENNLIGATSVMRTFLEWIVSSTPEYIQ